MCRHNPPTKCISHNAMHVYNRVDCSLYLETVEMIPLVLDHYNNMPVFLIVFTKSIVAWNDKQCAALSRTAHVHSAGTDNLLGGVAVPSLEVAGARRDGHSHSEVLVARGREAADRAGAPLSRRRSLPALLPSHSQVLRQAVNDSLSRPTSTLYRLPFTACYIWKNESNVQQ